MLVNYNQLPEDSRVWVYPCSRKFYSQEIEGVIYKIEQFIASWLDPEVSVSYQFLYDRFIVFVVAPLNTLSNAMLDKKVAFILQLQQEYQVELLDKMNVCFKQGEFIQYKELKEFKKMLKNNSVSAKTVVFDNLVETKYDLESFWEVLITNSWYNRFL